MLAITSVIQFDVVVFILTATHTMDTMKSDPHMWSVSPLYSLIFRDGETMHFLYISHCEMLTDFQVACTLCERLSVCRLEVTILKLHDKGYDYCKCIPLHLFLGRSYEKE